MVGRFLSQGTHRLSAYSFVNIFLWSDFFDFTFEIVEDALCVFAQNEVGRFLYWPPLSSQINAQAVNRCFSMMEEFNQGRGVSRIENVHEKDLIFFPEDQFSWLNKGYEYCCYRPELDSQQGNRFKSKRSAYNQFVRNYQNRFLPFTGDRQAECEQLYNCWAESKLEKLTDEIQRHMIEENRLVHRLAMTYFRELGLIGRMVEVNGTIKAYTFGFPIQEQIFCVLFEIADVSVKGLPTYIFQEFCQDREVRRYDFINIMDDLDSETIRKTKTSSRYRIKFPNYVVYQKH